MKADFDHIFFTFDQPIESRSVDAKTDNCFGCNDFELRTKDWETPLSHYSGIYGNRDKLIQLEKWIAPSQNIRISYVNLGIACDKIFKNSYK